MCNHSNIKIIPTAENSWGIEDTYDVKCKDCGKTVFAGQSRDELLQVLSNKKYSLLFGKEYLFKNL